MKHLKTEVEGSRKRRIYDMPLTPFARLKASGTLEASCLHELETLQARLDPFALRKFIGRKLRRVLRYCACTASDKAAACGMTSGVGGDTSS